MEQLMSDMRARGGAATRKEMQALGHSKRSLAAAARESMLVCPSRSWLVVPDADPRIGEVLAAGGRVGGATALETLGLWVTVTGQTWAAVQPGAHYRSLPDGVRRLECGFETDPAATWRVSTIDALAQHVRKVPRNDAVASLDSALRGKLLAPHDLDALAAKLPRRCRGWLRRVDARADSGLESILRLACEDAGWDVQVQVRVPGGYVDLLINGWLYLETDGSEFHDVAAQAKKDRRRNSIIARMGGRWHRFSYEDVVFRLDDSMALIRQLLAQGRPATPRMV